MASCTNGDGVGQGNGPGQGGGGQGSQMGGSGMMIPSARAGLVLGKAKANDKVIANQERVIHLDMGDSVLFLFILIPGP